MLVFPAGIRLSEPHEIMGGPDKDELIEKVCNARIEQGYFIRVANDPLFQFYAKVNVDAPQLWQVFRSLCEALLPKKARPIVGAIDEEPLHNGKYDDVTSLLAILEPFEYYLANDGFIQFGLAAQSQIELAEVFIAPTKHLQVWMNEIEIFKSVMRNYGIAESGNLQSINEFPRITSPLQYKNEFHNYDELVDHLVEVTGEL